MTWTMLKSLCDLGKFSVAAHTHDHVDIRTLDAETMNLQIQQSAGLLEKRLGMYANGFCMPYGKYDYKSIENLKKSGKYKFIFASFYGHAKENNLMSHLLPRIGISNDDSLEVFEKKLQGKLNWKGPIQRLRLKLENWKGERIIQYNID